jgi:Family of unknown function (DUF6445)
MHNGAMFNPDPRIERVPLHDGHVCYVVDDALVEPEHLRAWAVARRDEFRPVDFNAYPGQYLLLPERYNEALQSFYLCHIRAHFDARRLLRMHCRLSMVSTPPSLLRPYQWLCHSDNFALDPAQSIQASVHYLFEDAALGGTSFYKPRRPESEISRLFDDATRMGADPFTQRYGIGPGYMVGDNDYFTRTGSIPARWNRMIFYDGSLLHSGDIVTPESLTDDPATGRLTFNGFFTARRNAG